jgi:DNA-binding NtrC family response regulator
MSRSVVGTAPVRTRPVLEPAIKTLADAERAHITATLQETNWVVGGPRGAAAQLGLPRTTLIARMQRLGISNETSAHGGRELNREFASGSRVLIGHRAAFAGR